MTVTLVISTGRCGSTALSNMLTSHQRVLGVQEFFSMLPDAALSPEPVNGRAFWKILTDTGHIMSQVGRQGLPLPPEIRYPLGKGRFSLDELPAMCVASLPALSDDPDGLYDELAEVVPGWPLRPMTEHYHRLFDWLGRRLARDVTVERSGGILARTGALRALFPDARLILLLREGMETAISMSRHPSFQLLAHQHEARLRSKYRTASPASALPIETFGRLWSGMIQAGVPALADLPGDRMLVLSYEDLTADPRPHLRRLAAFIGIDPDEEWLTACSLRVTAPPARAPHLSEDDRARLRRSCMPGERALRRAAIEPRREPGLART